jgi:hypothetical protein
MAGGEKYYKPAKIQQMEKIKQKSPPGNLSAEISRRALKKMD